MRFPANTETPKGDVDYPDAVTELVSSHIQTRQNMFLRIHTLLPSTEPKAYQARAHASKSKNPLHSSQRTPPRKKMSHTYADSQHRSKTKSTGSSKSILKLSQYFKRHKIEHDYADSHCQSVLLRKQKAATHNVPKPHFCSTPKVSLSYADSQCQNSDF